MKTLKQLGVFAAKQKVLIAEDEEILNRQLRDLLQKFYLKVDSAHDGQEALELYRKNDGYDIVLSDIRMPRMDGIELSRELKTLKPDQNIIIVSAHHETEYFIELINIGIDGFILKPVKTHQLAQSLLKTSESIVHKKQFELLRARQYIQSLRAQVSGKSSRPTGYGRVMEQVSQISQEEQTRRQQEALESFNQGKQSAQEFIQELQQDPHEWESTLTDIDRMMELGEDLDSLISEMITEGFSLDMRETFLDIFEHYRIIFDHFTCFSAIADAVHELTTSLEQVDVEGMDQGQITVLASMLESLAEDIQKFTTHIFIDRDTMDIHYLDDALTANIKQICNKLEGVEEDGGDLDLF
ncbi:response regulator transcription factor [Desulfurispira natronophila]|uniref:YesN/AraC family two-component response regulator n=1 Tax=Desulfurispira natronophila TaxID=682562 RepID=A0A7W7Y491_9BACT|nr:response regulator [Desulfurispira natronophila]MBB5021821.1 YesN/AraC family two-component response regulator [Desulfurispira natronophila]